MLPAIYTMSSKRQDRDDDRTVADMSLLREETPQIEMPPEDRRMYIFGAMGAAALIGMIFLVAGFVVILLMILLWT